MTSFTRILARLARAALALVALAAMAPVASADTLLMPPRDFLMNTSEVVWGVTTQANGSSYTMDFGDGSSTSGNVADRSYIHFNHTYTNSGTFVATLTVGLEQATVEVRVFNPATIGSAELRGVNINRAIQNGLRFLWYSQADRMNNFPDGAMTMWSGSSGHDRSVTAFAVYAFQNHGYKVPNDASMPTGLYERFIVQRGLNYIADTLDGQQWQYIQTGEYCYDIYEYDEFGNLVLDEFGNPVVIGQDCYPTYDYVLSPIMLNLQQPGDRDPCVGAGIEPAPCQGLMVDDNPGYATAVAALAFASSGALSRSIPAGLGSYNGGFVGGKTIGEVLQRVMNTVAWGQQDPSSDPNFPCIHAGGWDYGYYDSSCGRSDGSTLGWNVQALLDAGAAGVVEPAWVKDIFEQFALVGGENTVGTIDYVADGNPGNPDWENLEKAGILGTSRYYVGAPIGSAETYINTMWDNPNFDSCGGSSGGQNLGCAYPMYNIFKSLKIHGVSTVPNADATPGGTSDGDWYGQYENWLVDNQLDPTSPTNGSWSYGDYFNAPMAFSCCFDSQNGNTAIALLILAPVALITPDPGVFLDIGLAQQQQPVTVPPTFSTDPVTIVALPGEATHKVIATARSATLQPIPGVTISIGVVNGPHVNQVGQGTSNAEGQVEFTYTGTKSGLDQIRAFIGQFNSTTPSNIVQANWAIACDVNNTGAIDNGDLTLMRARVGQNASGPTDPYDPNRDGRVNITDVRFCQVRIPR